MKLRTVAILKAFLVGLVTGALVALGGILLSGCPVRVDVPGSDACPGYPTCGICASQPECSWCALPDGRRGCYGRGTTPADCGRGIRVTERCPEDGPLGTRPPDTSP